MRAHSLGNGDSIVLSSDLTVVNGASVVGERKTLIDNGNGQLKTKVEKEKNKNSFNLCLVNYAVFDSPILLFLPGKLCLTMADELF